VPVMQSTKRRQSADARTLGLTIPSALLARADKVRVVLRLLTAANGRLCCKSLFAPLIANFSSYRRGFRVNMWGTSSPGDKLTGDFGNRPDATSISDRGLFCLLAGNLSPGVFRLLQQNRHSTAVATLIKYVRC
jgi:hypothetical protein